MGRQQGVLLVSGSIGNLSFYYDRVHGYLVRCKGGATKEQIRTLPCFERTRENNNEFRMAQKAGKLIRTAVRSHLPMPQDPTIARRLAQLLLQLKNLDTTNVRGERTAANGLLTPQGRALLSALAFHEGYALADVLKRSVVPDLAGGTFAFGQLTPREDFRAPAAATHVRLQGASGVFDFAQERFRMRTTPIAELALSDPPQSLVLELNGLPGGPGTALGFLSVVFLQEQNGERYVLREGSALGVLALES